MANIEYLIITIIMLINYLNKVKKKKVESKKVLL